MGEDVALEFAADVTAAVASIRELTDQAQQLADAYSAATGEVAADMDRVAGAASATAAEVKAANAEIASSSEAAGAAAKAAADEAVAAQGEAATAAKVSGDTAAASAAKSGTAGEAAAAGGLGKYKMALVGIGVGAAVAVDAAGKFQDQTTHLVTDAGESAKNLSMVQQGILGVSASTGTSASQITDAMYHIESSGFHAATGLAILKTTAEGAKVGGADLDTTSKALVGTLTAYYGTSLTAGQATKDSTALMNELITTVGSGDMRMQDLASSIHSVAPVAAAAHVSFAQVGGALATMTAQGMTAQQATQNLGHVIGSLGSPTNVMATEMKAMGLNANDVAKNLGKTGLSGTINELRDAVLSHTQGGSVMLNMLKGMSPAAQDLANKILAGSISTKDLTSAMKQLNPQQYTLVSHFKSAAVSVTGMQQTYTGAMSKMLGGQMGLNVGLMLTGKHMQDVTTATKNIAAEGAKASTTVDNWSTIQGTFAFKTQQAKASLEDTGIALGSALLPAVTAILGPIAHFLALIASNKDASIALALVVGTILAGAIGTKAVHALTSFKDAMKTAVDGVQAAAGWVKKLAGASDEQVAASKKAGDAAKASAAEQETASAEAAAAQETASGEAAAAQEADAAEAAAANEEAAATSSGSWVTAAARQVAAAATWVAQSAAKVAVAVAGYVAGAAATLAAWVAAGAGMVAQAVMWVAGTVAKVAVVVGANIAGAVATAAAWVIANAVMLLGIGLVVAAVALAVYEIVTHWHTIVHGVEEVWDAIYKFISGIVSDIVNFVKDHWQLLATILATVLLGPVGGLVVFLATHWKQVTADVSKLVSDVVGFFERLPGQILGFLERLPGDMLSIGQNIVRGLVNGIASMGSFLSSSIVNLVPSPIRSLVSGALGIFSPSTVFHGYGVNLVQGLVNGVRSMQGTLAGTMTALAGGVTSAGSAYSGGSAYAASAIAPAGGTSVHVSVPMTVQGSAGSAYSDPRFQQYMQQQVQEAVLRYGDINPDNGLTPQWGR